MRADPTMRRIPPKTRSANALRREHRELCFERAFPYTPQRFRHACKHLEAFAQRLGDSPRAVRRRLDDSGMGGTPLHYPFSYDVARWLARRVPGAVRIDWPRMGDTTQLDDLLRLILRPGEDEYFDSGYVTTRQWLDQARAGGSGTDFDWLMAQLQGSTFRAVWAQLYDAADIPLVWQLGDCPYSKSRNWIPVTQAKTRERGMRRRPRHIYREIRRPLVSIRKLGARDGSRLVDVAMASLAVRHRETYHFNFANPREVHLADVGEGVSIAVFGLLPEHRFPLECTMGYLILSNGVPIGYGGSSVLFRQVNTGVNIFDEYRGSEASFLWTQVMRVYHALTGCTRFIASAYQFGSENREALRSGAFWFYYRLGYRPILAEIRDIARREAARISRDTSHRSDLSTLRRLASCDMHLVLPGARRAELFDEAWLDTMSMLASRELAAAGGRTQAESARRLAAGLARTLNITDLARWSRAEKRAFNRIAPFVAAAQPEHWSDDARRSMRILLRSKGGDEEARFASRLGEHGVFLAALRKACRHADRE
jgi:hypothetical protein